MKRWPIKPLAEAYLFQEGPGVRKWQFRNSGIKLLNVANITKEGVLDLSKTDRHLSEEEVSEKYSHFLADAGDLVIASSGISFDDDGLLRTRGAFVEPKHLPLCLNTSTIRFKPKEGVSTLAWLRYWLDSGEFREQITRLVTGSAQQNFGPSHLKATKITLPPLAEQKRLIKLLDEADVLRKLRAQADHGTAALIPALFHEMFGDPLTNSSNWPEIALSESAERIIDCPHSTPHWQSDGVICVRTSNLGVGSWDWTDRRYVSEKEYCVRTRRSELVAGDIVLSREGTVGVAAIVPDGLRLCLGQRLVQLRPKIDRMKSEFLLNVLLEELAPANIQMKMAGSTSKHFNVGQLRALEVIAPPIPLQKEFAQRVAEMRELEAAQAASRARLDALFQSTLHRAFQGEL